MSEPNPILVDIKDAVATVTLNRPSKRNAMSPMLHLAMADMLEKLRYEKTSRVVVITGAGEAFCAGMDLKQFFVDLKDNPPEFDRIFRIATEWRFRTLRYYPKPTIAMVNGYCFGGAFSIVRAATWRLPLGKQRSAFRRSTSSTTPVAASASRSPISCVREKPCSTP
jgi:enoyl-CoA hydratase/carnithine racemase